MLMFSFIRSLIHSCISIFKDKEFAQVFVNLSLKMFKLRLDAHNVVAAAAAAVEHFYDSDL